MRPYEAIPLDDDDNTPLQQSTTTTTTTQQQQQTPSDNPPPFRPLPIRAPRSSRPAANANDGVFANLSAKPEGTATSSSSSSAGTSSNNNAVTATNTAGGKQFQEIEPPSYADIVHESPPAFLEAATVIGVNDDGDVLIEGLPVGNFLSFFINMLVSMSFDFIGFLLTSILATSHAARCGSRSGLGITLIRYGFYIQAKAIEEEDELEDDWSGAGRDRIDPNTGERVEDEIRTDVFVSYLLILVGFFVLLRANADFVRVKRMRDIVLSAPTSSV